MCREPLIVIEHEAIEVDYCVECRGVWLDSGELELLFGDAEACAQFLSIGAPATVPKGEKTRRCPACNKKMTKESTSSGKPVTFDHCPAGDGLWFDGGELETVLEQAEALLGHVAVKEYLGGIFSKKTPDAGA